MVNDYQELYLYSYINRALYMQLAYLAFLKLVPYRSLDSALRQFLLDDFLKFFEEVIHRLVAKLALHYKSNKREKEKEKEKTIS